LGAERHRVKLLKGCYSDASMRTVIVALALFACDHRAGALATPVNTRSAASRESIDAGAPVIPDPRVTDVPATDVRGPDVPSAVTFAAYATSSADGWAVGVEMAQAVTRVVVLDESAFSKPLSLPVRPGADGSFEASAHGVRLRGKVDGGTLKATIEAPDVNTFTAGRATPRATFNAVFGGAGVRLDWRQSNRKVTALMQRPAQPPHKLKGDVKGDVFALTEKDGRGNVVARLEGALLGERAALARWTTGDVSEPLTLDSAVVSLYPAVLTLPSGAKIAPVEQYDTSDGCVTDSVFPRVSNVPVEEMLNKEINKQLRLTPNADSSCVPMGIWDVSTYEVTAHGRDWVSFDVRSYSYRGGTHGGGGSRCAIASIEDGKLVSLARELPERSLKKLEPLVRAALLKGASSKSVTELGFVSDDLKIDAERPMCVRNDHGALFLEIVYGDDEGMFRNPGPPRARVRGSSIRGLFPSGTLGERIFR
jgi:hypothetical protein